MTIKESISLLRLRTLPLSASGVILGSCLAAADYKTSPLVAVFILLTALSLQIVSNISNDIGDFRNGVKSSRDDNNFVSLSEGQMSEKEINTLLKIWIGITVANGLLMIYFSFGTLFCLDSFILMILGYFAINAAMKYTLGKNPYGYRGLGDIYVFIFFGLVSVVGSYFVCSHSFGTWMTFLPATAIGCFSVAVLNVNNIRDIESDRQSRVTVAIRLGERNAKIYQTGLISIGWACLLCFTLMRIFDLWHFLFFLTLPLYILHLLIVWKNSGKSLDKALPLLVISTFALSVLFGLGFIVFLL